MRSVEERLSDIERRLKTLILHGKISEVNYAQARVRVDLGEGSDATGWLPWYTARANGADISWDAPAVGECVSVFCPNGSVHDGRVLPAIYSGSNPAPSDDPRIHQRSFEDEGFIKYDAEQSRYEIEPPAEGEIRLKVGGTYFRIDNDECHVETGTMSISAETLQVFATSVVFDADSVKLDAPDIRLGGGNAHKKVARVGDKVNLNTGLILEGSDVTSST